MFSLDKYIEFTENEHINMDAVLVIQNDQILGMHRFHDTGDHNVYSVAKSFLATAIGMAIEEGLMELSDKPVDYFPELLPEDLDDRWNRVTLEHLLTMTSGHGTSYMMSKERNFLRGETEKKPSPSVMEEWLSYVFTLPMAYEPGQIFRYGNQSPYIAARMLEKACGMTVLDYLYEKLWKPLGSKKPRWDPDNAGHTFPASDLYLDIMDMARLGQIYLGKGTYQGKRYLSEEWVNTATSVHVSSSVINPTGYAKDEEQGYGYYFWKNTMGGYHSYGREGQYILIFPEKNAVIVTQAMHNDAQQVLDAVWEFIWPQLS